MKYYKVVQNHGGKLFPLVHPAIGVEYKVDEWTKPLEGTQLICLDSLIEAKRWSDNWNGEIWECEVIKTKSIPIFLLKGNIDTYNVLDFIKKISKLKKSKKKFTHLLDKASYVFCDSIKLTQKVCYY